MPMNPRLLRPTSSGFHPEAQVWRNAVIANGGSVSVSTLKAVSDFCKGIDQAGIRDRFFRLNLFAGSGGLAACLVPLYRGPSRTSTQWGNARDTNVNFVSGDYTETGSGGGLATGASNSTKYLATGFSAFAAGLVHNDTHISWYSRAAITSNGNISGSTQSVFTWQAYPFGALSLFFYRSGGSFSSGIENVAWSGANRSGHGIAQRNSGGGVLYRNGTNLNVASTTTNAGTFGGDFGEQYVFARQLNNVADQYLACTLQSYSLGRSFTDSQAAAYYTAMQAFQAALGRQL